MKIFKIFMVLTVFLNGSVLFGQKLFVDGFGTYQFKLGGTIVPNSTLIEDSTSSEAVNINLGAGFGAGLIFGGEIKNDLMWEARIYYISGIPSEFENSYIYMGLGTKTKTELSLFSIRVEPGIRMKFGNNKLKLGVAVGPAFSIFNKMIEDKKTDVFYSFFSYNISDSDEEFTGGFGFGGFGAVSLSYPFWKHWELFTELNFNSLFWSPKKSVYTKFYSNGDNMLESMTTNEKETEYVNEFQQGGSSVDEDQPSKEIKSNYSMSTYGIKLGVRFKIFKNTSEKDTPSSL